MWRFIGSAPFVFGAVIIKIDKKECVLRRDTKWKWNKRTHAKRVINDAKFRETELPVCVCMCMFVMHKERIKNLVNSIRKRKRNAFDGCNQQNWNGIEKLCQECQLNRTLMKCSAYLKFIANAFLVHTSNTHALIPLLPSNHIECARCFGMVGGSYQFHNTNAHIFKLRQTNYRNHERKAIREIERSATKNLSKNVCSLEMQTPLAIRVTHSYNKCDTIFGCQTFCTIQLHSAAVAVAATLRFLLLMLLCST